ncbi:DNRLRE domain-containing protein [Marinicrinis lubricantis]|uniref:DNRLRE domain-containing protein n=1 Tax=Marinicrinis lubricantis TaxID=2086470 RepID=A0ABW1IUN3_9BACL
MRIIQGPLEIAGQMGLQSRGLQALGHNVDSYNIEHNYLGYSKGIMNVSQSQLRAQLAASQHKYDVFHFHYGKSMNKGMDFRFARDRNRVRIMQFWGNDVRTRQEAAIYNPYSRLIDTYLDEHLVVSQLEQSSRYMQACIVQDFEVAEYVRSYFDRIYVLPIACDVLTTPVQLPDPNAVPRIIHAPTHAYFKGTGYIEEVLNRLAGEGFAFHYERIQRVSNEEALQRYQTADIVIDQVYNGSYGLLSVEAMALGKPVVAYIREDLKHRYPAEMPIVSASPAQLYMKLKWLLQHPASWPEIGSSGRRYAESYHDYRLNGRHLEWIYRRERAILDGVIQEEPSLIYLKGRERIRYSINSSRYISIDGQLLERLEEPVNSEARWSERTVILKPNRYYKSNGNRKPAAYFSFNLAAIPQDAVIHKAVLRLPVATKYKQVKVHRVAQGWDTKSIRRKKPRRKPKSIASFQRPKKQKKSQRSVFQWECTELAKRWKDRQLTNHGLVVHKKVWRAPDLIVTAVMSE